jgi:hypothetical protein
VSTVNLSEYPDISTPTVDIERSWTHAWNWKVSPCDSLSVCATVTGLGVRSRNGTIDKVLVVQTGIHHTSDSGASDVDIISQSVPGESTTLCPTQVASTTRKQVVAAVVATVCQDIGGVYPKRTVVKRATPFGSVDGTILEVGSCYGVSSQNGISDRPVSQIGSLDYSVCETWIRTTTS